jgi:hypothetical protein
VKSNSSGLTRKRLAGLIRDLAEACENEELDVVKSLFFNSPLSTLQNVSENDLRVGLDYSWFSPDPKIERVKCLQFMVEQGLNPTLSSVQHLAIQLDLNMEHLELGAASAMPLLFEENAPLAVQSRLTQYAFLFAVSRGPIELVSKLLEQGILDTLSKMPDAGFVQRIHRPDMHFGGPPPNGSIANTSRDLGPCALILALYRHEYRAASLLLEHGVESQRGIHYLVTSESAMQHLQDQIPFDFRRHLVSVPDYLGLLERRLLAPAIIIARLLVAKSKSQIVSQRSNHEADSEKMELLSRQPSHDPFEVDEIEVDDEDDDSDEEFEMAALKLPPNMAKYSMRSTRMTAAAY